MIKKKIQWYLVVLVCFVFTLTYYSQNKRCEHDELTGSSFIGQLWSAVFLHHQCYMGLQGKMMTKFVPVTDSKSCCTQLVSKPLFIFSCELSRSS